MSGWPSLKMPPSGAAGAPGAARTLLTRAFASVALLALVGTYVAVEIDFVRRHHPGIAPERYWIPQVTHVVLPGLGAAALFATLAFALERGRRQT